MARGKLEPENEIARDLIELGLYDVDFANRVARVFVKDAKQAGVMMYVGGWRVVVEVDEKRKEEYRIRRWSGIGKGLNNAEGQDKED